MKHSEPHRDTLNKLRSPSKNPKEGYPPTGVPRAFGNVSSPPGTDDLLYLQRTIGNQGVARMLAGMSAPQNSALGSNDIPVQRFFTGPNGVRISDNDAFSVHPDNKTVFATQGAIERSNGNLAALNALVKFVPTGLSAAGRLEVIPAINEAAVTERIGSNARWKRLPEKNVTGGYRTFADCFQTSATISGLHPGNEQPGKRKGSFEEVPASMRFRWGVLPICGTQRGKELGAANAGARAAVSFYLHAFPEFGVLIKGHDQAGGLDGRLSLYGDTGGTTFSKGQRLYDEIVKKPDLLQLFATRYDINESVAPAIGTALVNVGDAAEVAKSDGKWNMHWAGIVFVDGSDYVTLENFALEFSEMTVEDALENTDLFSDRPVPLSDVVLVDLARTKFIAFDVDGKVSEYLLNNPRGSQREKTDIINQRWVFKMYGKAADSFHAKAGGDPHATKATLTLPVSKADG